jgi:hypothetical protein
MIPRTVLHPRAGSEAATEPLNFKVTKTLRRRIRYAALDADMKLVELLAAMVDLWERTHGDKQ